MGLFGSKTKTYVGTSVSRVINDESVPNSPKTGAIKGILNNGEIVQYVLDEVLGSVGIKADRMYEYAKKNYPIGLPTKTFQNRSKGRPEIETILQGIHGQPVELIYANFGPPNLTHIGWMKLKANEGYNFDTNKLEKLSTSLGKPVYLDNLTMLLPTDRASEYESGALEQWGDSPASGYKDWEPYNQDLPQVVPQPLVTHVDGLPDEMIRISYGYLERIGYQSKVVKGHFDMDTAGFIDDADYYHVKYKVDGNLYFWMYRQGEGTYPTLDALFEDDAELGSFYPMTYLRYDKKPMNQDTSTTEYKTSKKMCKYLGLNYDDLIDMVHENPDIDDVEQAIMMYAIPANTTDQMEQRYLFTFFDEMYFAVGGVPISVSGTGSGIFKDLIPAKNAVIIQDKLFKMGMNTSGLQKFKHKGVVAKIGEYSSTFDKQEIPTEYTNENGDVFPSTAFVDYHAYRKQVSDNLYEEVRVYNLRMTYYIWGGFTKTADDLDNILLIPLDKSIVDDFTIPEKERLIARALHFVFNSRTVIKLKWYQTGLFQAFIIIIAIILMIFTYGASWAATGAAIAAGGTAAVIAIQAAIIGILNAMVYAYAFKLFVQAVGPEFALLVAIVAVAYGGYQMLGETKGLWADNLLMVGNGLVKATQNFYGDALEGLNAEMQEFSSLAQQMEADLKKASDALMTSSNLSPFVIFGEKPDDFYNRTVHSGNIGTQSIAAVSNYYDIALQLPKLNDTV